MPLGLLERIGPAHEQKFIVSICIEGKEIEIGEGKSKKLASHNAALKAALKLGLL